VHMLMVIDGGIVLLEVFPLSVSSGGGTQGARLFGELLGDGVAGLVDADPEVGLTSWRLKSYARRAIIAYYAPSSNITPDLSVNQSQLFNLADRII
jgi:hypothetical protein